MARFLVWLINGYQYLLSPLLGSNCRFSPSCSHYACQALQKYGVWQGSQFAVRRLLRCHPWHDGGYDPLP
jgi:hypothetical protein